MKRFDGRVAVVTGAAGGIGAAAAHRLSDEGASVVVVDRDEEGLADLVLPGPAMALTADTADPGAVDHVVTQIAQRFGGIDILVANAGIFGERSFLDLELEEFDRIVAVNLRGTFLIGQRVARAMVASGRRGSIVITASINAAVAEINTAHYNSSKGGVLMLMKSMAVDLAPHGIRVNAIAPGTTHTPMTRNILEELTESDVAVSIPPLGRWGHAQDCAAAIAYLASEDASYVTGSTLTVDGGRTALYGPTK